jgi:hypothetical protein
MRKSIIGLMGLAALAMSAQSDNRIANDLPQVGYGSGNGAGLFHGYSSPIYIPYKHPIQTYCSQQRAAKKRRK